MTNNNKKGRDGISRATQNNLHPQSNTADALRGWFALAATAKRNQQPKSWKRHRGHVDLELLTLAAICAAAASAAMVWGGL